MFCKNVGSCIKNETWLAKLVNIDSEKTKYKENLHRNMITCNSAQYGTMSYQIFDIFRQNQLTSDILSNKRIKIN